MEMEAVDQSVKILLRYHSALHSRSQRWVYATQRPACYFLPIIRLRYSSLQPDGSSVCQLGPLLHLGALPGLCNTEAGMWVCSNTVQKLVSGRERLPLWVFQRVFRTFLLCSWNTREEDLAVICFLVCYPFGKTCVLERFEGHCQLGLSLGSCGYWTAVFCCSHTACAGIEEVPDTDLPEDQGQWAPVVYYQAFSVCFTSMNLLSLWHSCFTKYATVSTSKHQLFSVVRLNVCLLKLFLWILGIAVLDQAKGLSISLQSFFCSFLIDSV